MITGQWVKAVHLPAAAFLQSQLAAAVDDEVSHGARATTGRRAGAPRTRFELWSWSDVNPQCAETSAGTSARSIVLPGATRITGSSNGPPPR